LIHLLDQSDLHAYEIIVVDYGKGDTGRMIADLHQPPKVRLIHLPGSQQFVGALRNAGIDRPGVKLSS
jgi:hypothetical protein